MNKDLMTINDLKNELDIGKNEAYNLIHSGEIPSGKIAGKYVIHRSEFERYIKKATNVSDK